MPSPSDREKALDTALAQIDRQFGKGSVMRLGSDDRAPVEAIPTGSIALDVALGIYLAVNVHYIAVNETSHYLGNRIGFTDVGKELVSQTFTHRSAAHDTGDVDKRDWSRKQTLRTVHV